MTVLEPEEARRIDAYWRAANYLSVGQIYLLDNPLLREPLRPEHVKPRLLGHWGTTPGLNLLYAHMNRAIRARDLDAIFVTGPGPRRPGARRQHLARGHLQRGLPARHAATRRACASCSASSRSRAGSRATSRPRRPGSIHEGGELGYALVHAYGAAFDNPDLLVCCVVGDGEAETGPLAASWHSNKFLDPGARRRGAADPAPQRLQDRQPDGARADPRGRSCAALLRGLRAPAALRRGRRARGDAPELAAALDEALDEIARSRPRARRRARAAALADDRAAHAEGLDRARRRSTGCRPRARSARTRCRSPGCARTPSTSRSSRSGCAPTGPRSCSTSDGAPRGELRAPGAGGRAADGRQPARQRRRAAARPRAARLPRLRRRRADAPGDDVERGDARARRASCATSMRRQPARRSASSGPTRPPRTGSARCSR